MKNFFDKLESAGFKNAHSVEELVSNANNELVKSTLTKSMPLIYLKVINELTDQTKKEVLLTVANNINLYIKTKFGDTRIFENWVSNGVIPSTYHNGLNSRNLSLIAKNIIKISDRIKKDTSKIQTIEPKRSKDKPHSTRQVSVLENAYERISHNQREKSKYENEFYFTLIDLESSLGGIY